MANRSLRGIVAAGLALAAWGNAQTCKDAVLYDGNSLNGNMEESSRTFPEAPEWTANWGDFDNMKSPYIRLSGIKNEKSDWTGNLAFNTLPLSVNGGTMSITVRATQNAKFGTWLTGDKGAGSISFHTLNANQTSVIQVPVANLIGTGSVVKKIGIGLFDVPPYQYTTLFIDNVKFSCAGNAANTSGSVASNENGGSMNNGAGVSGAGVSGSESNLGGYIFADVNPTSPVRNWISNGEPAKAAKMALSPQKRDEYKQITSRLFVLTESEHNQIVNFRDRQNMTTAESRDGWYNSMFLVDRNRVKDSVIANPKNLFHDAGIIAAESENRTIPLLVADIDYAVKYFSDSTLTSTTLKNYHLLLSGFPTGEVSGSKISIVYDPYFAVTTRTTLPEVEICVNSKCEKIAPKSTIPIEFESAGVQDIIVKMHSDEVDTRQTLKLEVK